MNYYEIINPSDPYTLAAEDDRVAIAAVLLLGQGKYGLHKHGDDEFKGPPPLFGTEADYDQLLGSSIGEFIRAHEAEIAEALDSVMIGELSNRLDFEAVLAKVPSQADRDELIQERHDRCSSSLNNIGACAKEYAQEIRAVMASEDNRDNP